MALTKKMLRAMGIEDDKADQIMDAHTETVDALKEQREQYKADAEKLPAVQKQLDQAAADLESAGKDPYKVKYDALKEEYAQYKAGQQAKEARSAKEGAYRELLKAAGIPDKRLDAVLRVSDIDALELGEDGKPKDADQLTARIKTEWADFIPTTTEQGAQTATPPGNNPHQPAKDPGEMSMAEYINYRKGE